MNVTMNETVQVLSSTPPPIATTIDMPTFAPPGFPTSSTWHLEHAQVGVAPVVSRETTQDVAPLLYMESYNALLCTVFLCVLLYLRYRLMKLKRAEQIDGGGGRRSEWTLLRSVRQVDDEVI